MMAGIAVAITGGDAEAINLAAAAAGGNAAENNYLSHAEIDDLKAKRFLCHGDAACEQKVIDEYIMLSKTNDSALQAECSANPTGPACAGYIQAALNYAGDKQETEGIAESMGSDINRSRVVVLDQSLNGGSYGAVDNIETRADFFGAMGEQTGAPWFKPAEDVSRDYLQGSLFDFGDRLNGRNLSKWRDAAGNEIMKNGSNNFRSIYNNPTQDVNQWSVNQLVNEQNDPKLQTIHQQYIPGFKGGVRWGMETLGGVSDLLSPTERIKAGCEMMGMISNCGSAR